MGILDLFFRKKEEAEHVPKINAALKSSFSNVKRDILHLHTNLSTHQEHTSKKFQDFEQRIKYLELALKSSQQYVLRASKKEELIQEETEEIPDEETTLNFLKGLPQAELKLFRALYELQLSLNAKHISYKSLASYIYPGKDYNSIRSTITQFVLRLYTEGLVDKQRIGKETYVKVTPNGHKILKSAKMKKLAKEIQA